MRSSWPAGSGDLCGEESVSECCITSASVPMQAIKRCSCFEGSMWVYKKRVQGVKQILSCKRSSINRDKSPRVLVVPVPHHYVYSECVSDCVGVGVYKSVFSFSAKDPDKHVLRTQCSSAGHHTCAPRTETVILT